jgi:hypothetical protein
VVFTLNVSPTAKKINAINQTVPAGKLLQEISMNHQNKEENKNVNNGENDLTLSVDRDDLSFFF